MGRHAIEEQPEVTHPAYNLLIYLEESGVPGRTRTCDPQFRKLLLYPAELRGRRGKNNPAARLAPAGSRSGDDLGWLRRRFGPASAVDLSQKRFHHRKRPKDCAVVAIA